MCYVTKNDPEQLNFYVPISQLSVQEELVIFWGTK